jgi:hypothetical protein
VVSLGRARDCDLVLPHESVSRLHAEIRALGESLTIEDRSAYGTTVNGKRVVTRPLKTGDTIAIGPYVITVTAKREQRAMDTADTKPFRLESLTKEAMQGSLQKVPLTEVLQQIEFTQKTGTLKVFNDEAELTGMVVAYEGKPMYAELGEGKVADLEAILLMLTWERGHYSFINSVEAGEMTMMGQTFTGVLLEAGRREDEGEE